MRKFSEGVINVSSIESSKEDDIKSKIRDIIQYSIELRPVPYTDDDREEVNPDSLDSAAKDIVEMLKKEGLI